MPGTNHGDGVVRGEVRELFDVPRQPALVAKVNMDGA